MSSDDDDDDVGVRGEVDYLSYLFNFSAHAVSVGLSSRKHN